MKKALIITYYWPPAGGPGVQRVLNIVERLSDFGWEPVILTVDNPSAPAVDKSLLSRIPKDCKVYRTQTKEPFKAYKKITGRKIEATLPKNIALDKKTSFKERVSRWIRANYFIPDARKGWKRFMVKEGLKIIENEKPDIIFSTSPPHSLQLGAKTLAKKSGLPWVADLRDPWTEAYWETQMPKTESSKKKNLKYEKAVLNSANRITTVGGGIQKMLQKKTIRPVSVIYNGYREFDNQFIPSEFFELIHLGNLSAMQSCNELIKAICLLTETEKKKLRLVFIGTLADEYKEILNNTPEINVEQIGFLPYEEMIIRARSASMLFLPRLNSSYSKSLISAKLFDYLALGRRVLAVADRGSDIENILHRTQNGQAFLPEEIKKMTTYISDTIAEAEAKNDMMLPQSEESKRYSGRENVRLLVEIFNELSG
ncbi:MAG: glycosyltransferase [Candidatus Marinimicrobia bacterium]|nr:glycosyltransferase [Candidatus Neomarinimicrobiota bacterium]